jgi:hypothetical protein
LLHFTVCLSVLLDNTWIGWPLSLSGFSHSFFHIHFNCMWFIYLTYGFIVIFFTISLGLEGGGYIYKGQHLSDFLTSRSQYKPIVKLVFSPFGFSCQFFPVVELLGQRI